MTAESGDVGTLEGHASDFVAELNGTLRAVLGEHAARFVAEASPIEQPQQRVAIHTDDSTAIPLTINGDECLALAITFDCSWDHQGRYLAVKRATFRVTPEGRGAPLFRYEYVDGMGPTLPSAHLHIHAHRDEFLFALFRGGHGKPASRRKAVDGETKRARPQLSDVHFPVGGPRMRPCLEDVLQMLHHEVGIEVEAGAQAALDAGRARWRRRQIGAAVRDAPEEAARVLREAGYLVESPDPIPPERISRLTEL